MVNVKQVHKVEVRPEEDVLEWPDGVEVLATNWKHENLVHVAVLAPKDTEWHCLRERSDGGACQNTVDGPNERCHVHDE